MQILAAKMRFFFPMFSAVGARLVLEAWFDFARLFAEQKRGAHVAATRQLRADFTPHRAIWLPENGGRVLQAKICTSK